MPEITYTDYLDKVHGGWFGKCLGGAAGAPFEGFKKLIDVRSFEDTIDPSLPNDDLDIQLLWLDVLQKRGLLIDGSDLAKAWYEHCSYSMSEYGYFIKNYERGILPPTSGSFNNSFFSQGNGCPIRSEICGFIFPANPRLAARYADLDGSLDHAGNSVYIEQFYAALESLAFFETDIHALIGKAKQFVPAGSATARCIDDMVRTHASRPDDPLAAREVALRYYGHHDFTYSLTNLSFVLIGLLYGEGDIRRTITTSLRCGYDTDCTCATAAAILGETLGFSRIDPALKTLCGTDFVVGIDVKRRDNSIATLAREVCLVGIEAAQSLNDACAITRLPPSVTPARHETPVAGVGLRIEYPGLPALGLDDETAFDLVVTNGTDRPFSGRATFSGEPEGWTLFVRECAVVLEAGTSLRIANRVWSSGDAVACRNVLSAGLVDEADRPVARIDFGIAGSSVWRMIGPFFDALDRPDVEPGYPSPHPAGCNLPTLECMVNNVADLAKPYIDETRIEREIDSRSSVIINAAEDLIPVDEHVSYRGQACFYLTQRVYSPAAREVWLVIGNNDAYRLWMNGTLVQSRDENRLWTPYNNFTLVKLVRGVNVLALKLLRRTEELRFSVGFRRYEGKHWHQQRWITDLRSLR